MAKATKNKKQNEESLPNLFPPDTRNSIIGAITGLSPLVICEILNLEEEIAKAGEDLSTAMAFLQCSTPKESLEKINYLETMGDGHLGFPSRDKDTRAWLKGVWDVFEALRHRLAELGLYVESKNPQV